MKTTGVFIGRFNPPHLGHLNVVKYALENIDELLIIIGSAMQRPSLRNPFSTNVVKQLFRSMCIEHGLDVGRIKFEFVEDYIYNELKWETRIREIVHSHNKDTSNVFLTGFKKDNTSYYLKAFPEYSDLPVTESYFNLSSTDIRKAILEGELSSYKDVVPKLLVSYTPSHIEKELQQFLELWENKKDVEQFTVGNVIVSSGHVLVEYNSERFLYNLPETSLSEKMTIRDASLDLSTHQLRLTRNIMSAREKSQHTFDEPFRHDYGRQISTFIFYVLSNNVELPKSKELNLQWMPLFKVKPELFDLDHYHIIKYFVGY